MAPVLHPEDSRICWRPVANLPDLWCATLETAWSAQDGLSAFLYCVKPDEAKASIRIHLRFGVVPAYWKAENPVDPWAEGPATCPLPGISEFTPPLLEVRPSSWLGSFAQGRLAAPPEGEWRHFEIISSDAVFHVISTGRLDVAYFTNI